MAEEISRNEGEITMKFTEKQIVSLSKIATERYMSQLIRIAKAHGATEEQLEKLVNLHLASSVAFLDQFVNCIENPRGFEVADGFEDKNVVLPTRGTLQAAGYDFRALDGAMILPGQSYVFDTGVKAFMPYGEVLKIYVRSSVGIKRNLMLANGTAIIDSDYYNNNDNDGHIMIALRNMGDTPQEIKAGERIAQGIFQTFLDCDDCPEEERDGGIGSTGK